MSIAKQKVLAFPGGGGQQLIPLQEDVLDLVDGRHHEERGHGRHQALQHHGNLLLGGVQGEFRHFTDEGNKKGHYLKLLVRLRHICLDLGETRDRADRKAPISIFRY